MPTMRAIQITRPKGPLELVDKEIPLPGHGQVRIKVQACGICHSDSFTVEGTYPGIKYPRTPGHEVAGTIDLIGEGVTGWKVGDRVGVGWFGGNCGQCESCRKGDFMTCVHLQTPGISYDGGYAEYMVAPATALALIPQDLTPEEAGPLMCAGITTFNSLRNSGARPGDLVAILGVGGLGHLAIQFSAKMGFNTVAIARGPEKEELAKRLGAKVYIDSQAHNPGMELKKHGGAKVVLATVTNSQAMAATIPGLAPSGKLIILGVSAEPMQITPVVLLGKRLSIQGWPSGTSMDSQETLSFCNLCGVRSLNEIYPLERAAEAYERMMSGQARFRVVLKMDSQ